MNVIIANIVVFKHIHNFFYDYLILNFIVGTNN